MEMMNKAIIVIICLILTTSADAAGFIFHWENIAADENLILGKPDQEALKNDSSALFSETPDYGTRDDRFIRSDEQKSIPAKQDDKKFFQNNVKLKFFPAEDVDKIMDDKHKIYSDNEEEKLSKFLNAMSSLIYDDSKIKSIENIGKVIEPQIHFYFEF